MQDLTREERKRLTECMKDSQFMNLLADYAKEISDPKHRLENELYIKQLEQEQGGPLTGENSVVMIPDACFCVQTRSNKNKCTVFLNICSSDKVERMTEKKVTQGGRTGSNFSIPLSLGKVKEDNINEKDNCLVYDIVFHPETAIQALGNVRFRNMIVELSMDQIDKSCDESLDRKFVSYKEASKGSPSPQTIRLEKQNLENSAQTGNEKPKRVDLSSQKEESEPLKKQSNDNPSDPTDELMRAFEKSLMGKTVSDFEDLKMPESQRPVSKKKLITEVASKENDDCTCDGYTIPKYSIVHRGNFKIEQHTMDNSTPFENIPAELIVKVILPRNHSAASIELDITKKSILLVDEKCLYKLNVDLPYEVEESSGSAKFEKKTRSLSVTISVLQPKVVPVPFVEPLNEEETTSNEEKEEESALEPTQEKQLPNDMTSDVSEEDSVGDEKQHVPLSVDPPVTLEDPNDISSDPVKILEESKPEMKETVVPKAVAEKTHSINFFDTTFTNRYLKEID